MTTVRHATASARFSSPTFISARAAARPTSCSTSCAVTTPTPSIWSAISSTAGRCSRGWYWPQIAQRRGAEAAAQGAQGRAHRLRARQSRRIPARLLRHAFRRHRGGGERHPRRRRRQALSGHPRRHLRSRGARRRAGSPCSATRPTISRSPLNRLFNALRRSFGVPYWSLSQWAKLKVKNAVNYIGAFEKTLAAEAQAPRRRRRDLRPHPPRRHPRRLRHPLHQLRRLGGKLHGGRRAHDGRFEIITWTHTAPRRARSVDSGAASARAA